jgi:hypothetical protein
MDKTKYDAEIDTLKTKLASKEEQSKKTYNEMEKIETDLRVLRNKQLLESGLLKKYMWVYRFDYQHSDNECITLVAKTNYWQELEEATGEKSYHWDHTIVKGELSTSGDDGTISLHIKRSAMGKWIKKLGLKIDIDNLNCQIADINYKIKEETEKRFLLVDLIKAAGGKVTGIDKDEYTMCPCWIDPSDPDSTKGTCEGEGGECRHSTAARDYTDCNNFATGCKQCGYSSCKFSKAK